MEVLIADDDALSRRILQDVLVTWGYQVKVTKMDMKRGKLCNGRTPPVWLSWIG